jgi:hypothetical protein
MRKIIVTLIIVIAISSIPLAAFATEELQPGPKTIKID